MSMPRFCVRSLVLAIAVFAIMPVAHGQWLWTPQTGRFIDIDRQPKETPELQVEFARSLLIEKRYKAALRETNKFEDFYGDSEYADENQFLRGEIFQAQGSLRKAANEYQLVWSNYPDSDRLQDVIDRQYEIADQYYDAGVAKQDKKWTMFRERPFKRAIDMYNLVISNERLTDKAAQARYRIGECYFARKEYLDAALEYRRVLEEYPGSDWVDEASYSLAMTYYNSSLPPAYDQAPSQLAIDAIDEFKVRFPADERNNDLAGKRDEMRESIAEQRLLTAQFYERRRRFEAALISYQVVVDQYAGTSAAVKAQDWLDQNAALIRSGKQPINPEPADSTPSETEAEPAA